MSIHARLLQRASDGPPIRIVVSGAGLIGSALVRQIDLTPAMHTALIVNRTPDFGVRAFHLAGHDSGAVVVSDSPQELQRAIDSGRPAVTTDPGVLPELQRLHAFVEATGAVEHGARSALYAIDASMHVIMMNAETDATVGWALKARADSAGVVYSNSDGDQPGVLKRLVNYVQCLGFDVVAAVNCKGFMDVHATPDTIRPWAMKQNTSLPMTTAFTDGTKMNIENAVLANSTGLVPEVRGMHGITTDLEHALDDCLAQFGRRGLVDYTLGGDFKGGVFVIAHCNEPHQVQPLMKYLKMGDGPDYLFFRPYHLCHFETPFSIAEAVLDHQPTIAPRENPVCEVVSIAKRNLKAGERLDGIGGYTCYGEIERAEKVSGMLPIGFAGDVLITRDVPADQAIPRDAVELDPSSLLLRLREPEEEERIPRVAG